MTRIATLLAIPLVVAVGCAGAAEPAAPTPLQRELTELVEEMARIHPDVDHEVPLSELRAEAAALAERAPAISRAELVVGLMRLTTLGDRDGHGGIFLFDPAHSRPFHFYPLRVHSFADGVHVVADATGRGLVGKRVTAIDGVPVADVVERVEPLIPHDNASTVRLLLPEYLVCAEALRGLGIVDGPATYAFADGSSVTLDQTVPASGYSLGTAYAPLPTPRPQLLYRGLDQPFVLAPLERGRSLYLGYHQVATPPQALLDRILRQARAPGFRRLVVDVRQNGGGNNTTYGPLIDLLRQQPLRRRGKVVVLIGRLTFSAAGNFAAEVDARTRALLVGEPSGGAPNQWGDRAPIVLRQIGLTAYVALEYVEVNSRDRRLAVEPDVRVEPTAADFRAGRDPVLARALGLR
jgi:Peptidase family S41